MRNKKTLLLDQLDKKIESFRFAENTSISERGWIYSIRKALNMTLEQLGNKLNITKQGVKKIEEREASGSISINTLRDIGAKLDMKLIYGFVPSDESLNSYVDKKAHQLAKKIVLKTNHNMTLENQAISNDSLKKSIEDLAYDIKREMRRSLWD